MGLMEAVAVFVAGILALAMADRLVPMSPLRQAGIDIVFVGMDQRAFGDHRGDDRLDRFLLNVGQHTQDDLSATLDQTQDRWFFLLERAAAWGAFEPSPASFPAFFWTAAGFPLCPATT